MSDGLGGHGQATAGGRIGFASQGMRCMKREENVKCDIMDRIPML